MRQNQLQALYSFVRGEIFLFSKTNPTGEFIHSSLERITQLQTHGNAMSKQMVVAFGNIYMAAIKTQILSRKRGIDDDIFSLGDINIQRRKI